MKTKQMRTGYFSMLVVCVLMLVGCGSSTTTGNAGSTPLPTIPPPPSTPVKINLTPLSLHDAWGDGHMAQFSLAMGDRWFEPASSAANNAANTITDDDQACGATVPIHSEQIGSTQDVSSVGLINVHTGHITPLTTLTVGYSMLSCTVTGSWVIWVQTYGPGFNGLPGVWKMIALNRATQEMRTLDQSKPGEGTHGPASVVPNPTASNGRMIWETYATDGSSTTEINLYTFATGAQTVLVPHTSVSPMAPQLSWPWGAWWDETQKAVVFKNLETGQQRSIPVPNSGTFVGDALAYIDSGTQIRNKSTQLYLYASVTTDHPTTYLIADQSIDHSDVIEFPTLNDRLVSWISNLSLVFDRKLMRQVKIDTIGVGFDGTLAGHFLLSTAPLTPTDNDAARMGLPYPHVLRVFDTNSLP